MVNKTILSFAFSCHCGIIKHTVNSKHNTLQTRIVGLQAVRWSSFIFLWNPHFQLWNTIGGIETCPRIGQGDEKFTDQESLLLYMWLLHSRLPWPCNPFRCVPLWWQWNAGLGRRFTSLSCKAYLAVRALGGLVENSRCRKFFFAQSEESQLSQPTWLKNRVRCGRYHPFGTTCGIKQAIDLSNGI